MTGVRSLKSDMKGIIAVLVVVVLAGCSTPKPSALDPELKLFAESASVAYLRGEVERADGLYQKALQRARLIDDQGEIARNTYNLALCRTVEGRLTEAHSLLRQAGSLSAGKGPEAARILLAEAEVARLSGELAESQQLAREAVAAGVDREGRVQAFLLQGEAEFGAGRLQGALEDYTSARAASSGRTPALLRSRLDELAIHLCQAKLLDADEAALQTSRAEWLKKAGQFKMMALALDSAAKRYEQDLRWTQAFSCRIRAAQSLLAAGNRDGARLMLQQAAEVAERTGNARDKALAAGLMGELK